MDHGRRAGEEGRVGREPCDENVGRGEVRVRRDRVVADEEDRAAACACGGGGARPVEVAGGVDGEAAQREDQRRGASCKERFHFGVEHGGVDAVVEGEAGAHRVSGRVGGERGEGRRVEREYVRAAQRAVAQLVADGRQAETGAQGVDGRAAAAKAAMRKSIEEAQAARAHPALQAGGKPHLADDGRVEAGHQRDRLEQHGRERHARGVGGGAGGNGKAAGQRKVRARHDGSEVGVASFQMGEEEVEDGLGPPGDGADAGRLVMARRGHVGGSGTDGMEVDAFGVGQRAKGFGGGEDRLEARAAQFERNGDEGVDVA